MEVIVITTRGLLNLVMDIAQALATTIEALKEFKDMVMVVITRGLLMLDTTMVMVNLMSTRAVLTTTDLMAMKLTMSIERGLLNLDMVMVVKAISMLTDLTLTTRSRCITLKLTTMDTERGLLHLAMV